MISDEPDYFTEQKHKQRPIEFSSIKHLQKKAKYAEHLLKDSV